jgi:hypothetical protein
VAEGDGDIEHRAAAYALDLLGIDVVHVLAAAAIETLLEQAAEHPRGLLVELHALGEQVARRLIVRFLG